LIEISEGARLPVGAVRLPEALVTAAVPMVAPMVDPATSDGGVRHQFWSLVDDCVSNNHSREAVFALASFSAMSMRLSAKRRHLTIQQAISSWPESSSNLPDRNDPSVPLQFGGFGLSVPVQRCASRVTEPSAVLPSRSARCGLIEDKRPRSTRWRRPVATQECRLTRRYGEDADPFVDASRSRRTGRNSRLPGPGPAATDFEFGSDKC